MSAKRIARDVGPSPPEIKPVHWDKLLTGLSKVPDWVSKADIIDVIFAKNVKADVINVVLQDQVDAGTVVHKHEPGHAGAPKGTDYYRLAELRGNAMDIGKEQPPAQIPLPHESPEDVPPGPPAQQ